MGSFIFWGLAISPYLRVVFIAVGKLMRRRRQARKRSFYIHEGL